MIALKIAIDLFEETNNTKVTVSVESDLTSVAFMDKEKSEVIVFDFCEPSEVLKFLINYKLKD